MEIAGYTSLETLGRGGFSTVYRAHQAAQSRDVALKVLSVDVSDAAARARFERECAANGRLGSHPNVMTVFESGYTSDGKPYISMELCSGGSLAEQLSGGTFPVADVLRMGIKIAGAVETAHRNGITHRDIKPENILTTSFGEFVLADFGISALDSVRSGTATAGSFTLSHVPPEVLQGEVSGVPGDIYSLGSTLYRLLTGRPPFADETTPLAVAITRTLNDPLPDPGANVPPALTRALEASMAKDPARRPATALEFAEMLQQVQREIGVPLTEPVVASIAPVAPSATPVNVPETPVEVVEAAQPRTPDVGPSDPEPAPVVQSPVGGAEPQPRADRTAEPTIVEVDTRPDRPGRNNKMLVGILAAVLLVGAGGFAVLAGGGSGGKGASEVVDTTLPASDTVVPTSVGTQTSVAPVVTTQKITTTTTAKSKATGSGSKSVTPATTVPITKQTSVSVTTVAPAVTAAPATSPPVASAATTTTVKISVGVTIPKILFGCLTRQACAQALVDAWVKNDTTAAKAAATSSNNYAAVTSIFSYPYKTYGTGFATTVARFSDTVYTLSSSRTTTPTKFSFVFDGNDATSVKVLAVLAQSK